MFRHSLEKLPVSIKIFIQIMAFIICYLLGHFGLFLAMPGTNISPIWPAAGFALAAVFLFGYQISLAIALASIFFNIRQVFEISPESTWVNIWISIFTGLGAGLQAAFGAFLIQKIYPSKELSDWTTVIVIFIAGATSALINSTLGVFLLCLSGIQPWSFFTTGWVTWWIGDTGGIFLITPLILAWYQNQFTLKNIKEIFIIGILFSIAAAINVYYEAHHTYLFFPPLIWSSVRFLFPGATLSLLISIVYLIIVTSQGLGPFAMSNPRQEFFELEIFMIIITISILLMTAEIERGRGIRTLWNGTMGPPEKRWKIAKYLQSIT